MQTKTAPNLTKAAGMIAPNLTFYTNPLAFNPGKVAVMLAEKRVVPQKTIKVDLFSGPSLEPAFMRISPSGAVPILVKDGEVIRESKTIAQLIDNLDGAPLGGDLVDRAFVNKFVEDIDAWDGNLWAFSHSPGPVTKIMKSVDEFRKKYAAARARENPDMKEIYEKKIATMSKAMEAASDPAQVKANEQMLSNLMDTAEGRLQSGWAPTTGPAVAVAESSASPNPEKFLGGPAYSIADALFAPILYRVESLGSYKEVIAPRPAVSAYMKRMQARPSWKAAFGEASSTWGKVSNFVPGLISIKIRSLLHRY